MRHRALWPVVVLVALACPLGAQAAWSWLHLFPPLEWTWLQLGWWWVLAPVLEEWVFRGLWWNELSRRGLPHWAAWWVTSLTFAAVHAPLVGWMAAWWLVPALLLGGVRALGSPLWLCMLLHAWMNACLFVVDRWA